MCIFIARLAKTVVGEGDNVPFSSPITAVIPTLCTQDLDMKKRKGVFLHNDNAILTMGKADDVRIFRQEFDGVLAGSRSVV